MKEAQKEWAGAAVTARPEVGFRGENNVNKRTQQSPRAQGSRRSCIPPMLPKLVVGTRGPSWSTAGCASRPRPSRCNAIWPVCSNTCRRWPMHPELFIERNVAQILTAGDTPRMWCTPQPRRPCGIFAPRRALPRGRPLPSVWRRERRWPSCCNASCASRRRTPRRRPNRRE